MAVEKMLGLGLTAVKSNFVRLRRPYKLNFCVTYRCQSRCLTCDIWKMKPTGELTLDEIRTFAQRNPYFQWIELTGGEVFLRGDIVEIARAFKENSKGLYILTMPTNSLCNQQMVMEKLTEILKLGIPRVAITVSLDGYRELHDRIRGIPGNFDKAMSMFKSLKRLKETYPGLYFVFGYTLSKLNQGQFERTYQAVKAEIPDIRHSDFHINLAQISENYYNNQGLDIRPNDAAVVEELNSIIGSREAQIGVIPAIENTFLKNLVYYAKTGRAPMRSKSLEASLFLDSYGNIFPSIMWNRKIGNIRELDYALDSIWEGDAAKEIRRMIAEGSEPQQWTACEAYQSIIGDMLSLVSPSGKRA
ncbi:MAG: radical SAM protein [Candidatus Micrarchaeota archaeon]|nr:radical SAM protein [Candidatus Micrarchaeota archaeon]